MDKAGPSHGELVVAAVDLIAGLVCVVLRACRVLLRGRGGQVYASAKGRVRGLPQHPRQRGHQGQQRHTHQEGKLSISISCAGRSPLSC